MGKPQTNNKKQISQISSAPRSRRFPSSPDSGTQSCQKIQWSEWWSDQNDKNWENPRKTHLLGHQLDMNIKSAFKAQKSLLGLWAEVSLYQILKSTSFGGLGPTAPSFRLVGKSTVETSGSLLLPQWLSWPREAFKFVSLIAFFSQPYWLVHIFCILKCVCVCVCVRISKQVLIGTNIHTFTYNILSYGCFRK